MKKVIYVMSLIMCFSFAAQSNATEIVYKERVLTGFAYNMTMPGYMPKRPVYQARITRITLKENSIRNKPKQLRNIPMMGRPTR